MSNYIIKTNDDNELYQHGVKGQKWGVRRRQKKLAREKMSKMKEKKKGLVGISNSAARSFYKAQNYKRKADKTNSFKKYRDLNKKSHRATEALHRKTAQLNEKQIKAGRYRIARNRNYRRTALSAVIGTGTGALAMAMGGAFLGVPIAAGAYVTSRYASGGRRYRREQKSYEKFVTKESKPSK